MGTANASAGGRRRSLWPREHGAYAQLGAPLLAAVVAGGATAAGGLLVLGAVLAFLAYEPLLVALGRRGRRALLGSGTRARWLGGALLIGALAAGGAGLARAPAAAALLAAAVAAPVLVLLVLAVRRAERTVPGEIVAAVALSGAAAPVAVACGAGVADAAVIWAAWSIGLAATVIAVHRVLARHRHAATWVDRWTAIALVVAAGALVGLAGALPWLAIAVPLVIVAAVLVLRPPRATRMHAVGFALLGTALMSVALQVGLASM